MSTTDPLTSWLQSRLTNHFYETAMDSDSSDSPSVAVKAIFSPNAQIFWNHVPISVDEYIEKISSNLLTKGASVEWKDVFEVTENSEETLQSGAGIVAGFLVVTRSLKFRVRVTPAQTQSFITLSAKIENDPNAETEDKRRIVHLFHTSVDKAVPVHIHGLNTN